MNIQIITNNEELVSEEGILVSSYAKPMALDDFEINIIDLSNRTLWYYNENYKLGLINDYSHLYAIKEMIETTRKAKVIYVYPQNYNYYYDYQYIYERNSRDYQNHIEFKQLITTADYIKNIGKYLYSDNVISDIIYEPTKTKIGNMEYDADFHFSGKIGIEYISNSLKSEKITTIKYNNFLYVTTLDICKTINGVKNFVNNTFKNENNENIPDWVREYNFGSDHKIKELIKTKNAEIDTLQEEVTKAEEKIEINNRYKSILCSSGEKLVEVVFEILEIILDHDLKDFIDKKEEDFLIEKDDIILIGEIKGVSSNVKNEHVSQLDVHYNKYIDDHESIDKNICALLIINPFRDIDLSMRETINEQQVSLAKRNGSLIIETKTLLKIFEMFNDGVVSTENIIEMFKNNTGLLKESDLSKFTNS